MVIDVTSRSEEKLKKHQEKNINSDRDFVFKTYEKKNCVFSQICIYSKNFKNCSFDSCPSQVQNIFWSENAINLK